MLYQKLGWSVFVGLGSIGAMIPIHIIMGKYFGTAKAAKLAAMDGRLRLVNEVLAGIKIVKLYNCKSFLCYAAIDSFLAQ
jgi:ATP-binding cassette subfamily C (CFTR/MRP) protein 1